MAQANQQNALGTQNAPGEQGPQSPAPGQLPGGQAQGQGTGQPQEPKWLSYVPEAEREEAKAGWLKDQDYRAKTEALANERKAWETEKPKFDELQKNYQALSGWYQNTYLPFYQRIEPKWKEIESYLNGQGQLQAQGQQNVPQNYQQNGNLFSDWDTLDGSQQAQKMADHLKTSYFDPALQQRDQQWQQFYGNKEKEWAGFIQRYNGIYADAIQRALQEHKNGRDFPIQDYVNAQLEIAGGKIDVPGLAYQRVVGDSRQKELEQEWYERGKKDHEQEVLNQQQNSGALLNSTVPIFKQQVKSREDILAMNRKIAAEKNIPWT